MYILSPKQLILDLRLHYAALPAEQAPEGQKKTMESMKAE